LRGMVGSAGSGLTFERGVRRTNEERLMIGCLLGALLMAGLDDEGTRILGEPIG
jgi:hypothetical protein